MTVFQKRKDCRVCIGASPSPFLIQKPAAQTLDLSLQELDLDMSLRGEAESQL